MGTATEFLLTDETAFEAASAMRRYVNGGDDYFVRPNLLDNWYFANPVNQKGITKWTAAGYTIDRWKKGANTHEVSIADGGLKVQSVQKANARGIFYSFEDDSFLYGKTYTFSALFTDVVSGTTAAFGFYRSKNKSSVYNDIASGNVISASNEISVVTHTFGNGPDSETYPYCVLYIGMKNTNEASAGFTVAAAKLELGDTQTLAHNEGTEENPIWVLNEAPDYGEQLWKCQRFYQLFRTSSKRPAYGPSFRPPMRLASPTTGTVSVGGTTHYYADANL